MSLFLRLLGVAWRAKSLQVIQRVATPIAERNNVVKLRLDILIWILAECILADVAAAILAVKHFIVVMLWKAYTTRYGHPE